MKRRPVEWVAGDPALRSKLERSLATDSVSQDRLHANSRRTVHRVVLPASPEDAEPSLQVVIKTHHTATGRHARRERIKRLVGRSPARREWHALGQLHAAGVARPRPLAWGRLDDGDEIVVSEYLEGIPVRDGFEVASDETRREIVHAIAEAVDPLHAAGYRHGDLHLGNLQWVGARIFLLDVQRARRLTSPRDRLFDLARLELSMARAGFTPTERGALRDRLQLDPTLRGVLPRFLRDHLRGRARRVLRPGRNWSVTRIAGLQGLRENSLDDESLTRLIETSRRDTVSPERRDGRVRLTEARIGDRELVIKRTTAKGPRHLLADRLRGSAAARAFRAGQTRALISNRVARPLAYLEERRFGLPWQSWLVLERVGDTDLDRFVPGDPETALRVARALGEWLADEHAWGLSHRDMKGSNLRLSVHPESVRFWMVDLEDLMPPSALSERSRLQPLSQLNASLADETFPATTRREALDAYDRRLPFSRDQTEIGKLIAMKSLAREHRWQGKDCDCVRSRPG